MTAIPSDYHAPQNLLKDRVILVTGAGAGIGRAAALTFAAHGATVVLLGRTLQKLEDVYDAIEAQDSPQPAIFPMNLEGAAEHDYEALHDTLLDEFGRLDGLLHNAGELGAHTPIANYSATKWQQVIQVNLTAPFLMTRALLPLLKASEDASIVFTSSGVAEKGRAFWGAYAASKAGTDNLMETLSDEIDSTNILRVNSINPGATRTAMRTKAYPAENPETLATPESIMLTYLYLMGPDSKGVNGQRFEAQPKK